MAEIVTQIFINRHPQRNHSIQIAIYENLFLSLMFIGFYLRCLWPVFRFENRRTYFSYANARICVHNPNRLISIGNLFIFACNGCSYELVFRFAKVNFSHAIFVVYKFVKSRDLAALNKILIVPSKIIQESYGSLTEYVCKLLMLRQRLCYSRTAENVLETDSYASVIDKNDKK